MEHSKLLPITFAIFIFLLPGCNKGSTAQDLSLPSSTPRPTISATPTSTPTLTATYAPTWTPNGWYEGIDSLLPAECQEKDPLVEDWVYEDQQFLSGSCKLPSLSSDGTLLAYVYAKTSSDSASNAWLSQVVKITSIGQNTSYEVFQSQKYTILEVEWSADGQLVIMDAPIEGNFYETIIYDSAQKQILQSLSGGFDSQSWNAQRTAFYTISASGPSDYGPACKNTLSVYDFVHDAVLINPEIPSASGDFYKVVDQPFWSSDGLQLSITIRPGLGELATFLDFQDILYGPASVLAIDISGSSPQQVTLASDPQLDFVFTIQPDGNFTISSSPYEQIDCWEIP